MALLEATTPGLVAGAAKAFLAMPYNSRKEPVWGSAPHGNKIEQNLQSKTRFDGTRTLHNRHLTLACSRRSVSIDTPVRLQNSASAARIRSMTAAGSAPAVARMAANRGR